jgi:hypothetical protein
MLELLENDRRRYGLKTPSHTIDFGIEIGALDTFFSFENQRLGKAELRQDAFKAHNNGNWFYTSRIRFSDALLMVSEEGQVDQTCGQRVLKVEAMENSRLMDAVVRFVLDKDQVKSAFIGAQEIIHQRKNRYHQYPLDLVTLHLKNGLVMSFQPIPSVLPPGFKHVVYLRDEPDKWILHIRALALNPSHYVLKGCTRWYNRPFPLIVQRIVLSSTWLRSRLLYVRERVSQRIPVQVNGAANLPKGGIIQLAVHWNISHDAS